MTEARERRSASLSPRLYKAINRDVGRAIHRYRMIADGDRIAVGVSGGKDSIALMWMLHERQSRVPVHYELQGIHIDLGFAGARSREIAEFSETMGFDLHVEITDYGPVAHSTANRENPCFLCSRLRKKRLFELASRYRCNKVALGHHKDDIIETLFLNMCYAGEISTMVPLQSFFGGEITVIRPLAFVDEAAIQRLAGALRFPEFPNPCPSSTQSKRKEIKTLLQELYRSNRNIKGNLFRALSNVRWDYLPKQ